MTEKSSEPVIAGPAAVAESELGKDVVVAAIPAMKASDSVSDDQGKPVGEDLPEQLSVDTDYTAPKRVGLLLMLLIFGVFGGWSLLAPISGAALAPGVVTVKSHKKTVQHLEGGIVKKIYARNGDVVAAGDVLLSMDATQSKAQLEIVKGQFIAQLAKESRLLAERETKASVAYSDELDLSDVRAQDEIESQNYLFKARTSARLGEIAVLEQRIEQLQESVKGLQGLKQSKQALLASYKEEVEDYQALLKEGFSDKVRLRDSERNYARLEGESAELLSSIAATKIQVGETKLQILQREKEFHTQVADELAQTQTGLSDVRERMHALQDTRERTEVRAPVAGIVHNLMVHTEGAVLSSGSPIMDIVPQSDDLVVEAQVALVDIDRVFVGQEVKVRFSAFKSSVTQVISGQLVSLSADRLTDEMTGMPYYMAMVEVTEVGVQEMQGLDLLPGMPAEVLISTGSRTLFQYMTQPVSDALARSLIED